MSKRPLSLGSKINLAVFGIPFRLAGLFFPPSPKLPQLDASSNVLVFTSAGLGDTLLDSTAVRALAETFPGIRIDAVVHHRRPALALYNPFFTKVHRLRKGPFAFISLFRQLRKEAHWNAILYLSCLDPEARCMGYLLNRHATAGLAFRTAFANLCAFNLKDAATCDAHLSIQALRVAEVFGAKLRASRMVYEVNATERNELDDFLSSNAFPLQPSVTLQLGGGGSAHRDWPASHFSALLRILHEQGESGPFFLLGGPDHVMKARQVLETTRDLPVHNVTGRLALPLTAALLERSKCVVSTDTGIMHLAFALRTPTVALIHWEPGIRRVGPLADAELHEVIELPRPEGINDPFASPMSQISPQEVARRVLKLLSRQCSGVGQPLADKIFSARNRFER